jgi:hypothetical protein
MDNQDQRDHGSSPEKSGGAAGERRIGDRLRTLITGRVYFNSTRSSLDCQIRNLSADGACLKGQGMTDVPDRFRLEIPSRNRIYSCHVRWRVGDMIGVFFEQPQATRRDESESLIERVGELEYENRVLRRKIVELSEKLAEFGVSTKGF